ncbi:hypothetical protein JL721_1847 [Aureococcus anophagefferens]|nr:hypothetical protein JL721_1847 [Aureococcus anophagefferens]
MMLARVLGLLLGLLPRAGGVYSDLPERHRKIVSEFQLLFSSSGARSSDGPCASGESLRTPELAICCDADRAPSARTTPRRDTPATVAPPGAVHVAIAAGRHGIGLVAAARSVVDAAADRRRCGSTSSRTPPGVAAWDAGAPSTARSASARFDVAAIDRAFVRRHSAVVARVLDHRREAPMTLTAQRLRSAPVNYARFFLEELFPDLAGERVAYLDPDVLVNADLAGLLATAFAGASVLEANERRYPKEPVVEFRPPPALAATKKNTRNRVMDDLYAASARRRAASLSSTRRRRLRPRWRAQGLTRAAEAWIARSLEPDANASLSDHPTQTPMTLAVASNYVPLAPAWNCPIHTGHGRDGGSTPPTSPAPMTTVYEFLAREIAREFLASLPSLGVMVVAMLLQAFVVPLRSARLLDDVACETEQCGAGDPIASTLLRIAACQAVAVACRAAERRLSEARAQRTRCRLRTRLFARVLRLDDACAEELLRLSSHAARAWRAWVVSEAVGAAVRGLVPLVGGGAAMYAADARLACVALGTAPLLFLVTKLRGRLAKAFAKTANEREAAALARAAEALANRSTVRSHGAEALEAAGFAKLVDGMMDARGACLRRDVGLGAAAELVAAAGELALLAAAARRRAAGGLTLGGYAAFRAALLQYQRGLRDATKCANKVASGLGAAERYVSLSTAYASSILDGEATAPSPPGPPEVRFEDVRFAYGSAPADAVAGVDLVCRAGATTALVGPSGSGKSSLGGLLLRLRDPRSGSSAGAPTAGLGVAAHRRASASSSRPCLFDRTLRRTWATASTRRRP